MNFYKSRIHKLLNSLFFLLTVFYCFHNSVIAQNTSSSSSPYSRYALGNIEEKGFAQNIAMGGTFIAVQNDTVPIFFINQGNPASYSNMKLVTAELGLNFSHVQLQSSTDKSTVNTAALNYIALAFPIKKWWGASIGIRPFTSVDYKISSNEDIENVGPVNYLYEGRGGVNDLYLGTAIRPFDNLSRRYVQSYDYRSLKSLKNPDNTAKSCQELYQNSQKIHKTLNRKKFIESLSLGLNASYMFGNVDNTRKTIFENKNALNTFIGTGTRIDGIAFDYGMQMAYLIDSVAHKDKSDPCRPKKYRDLKENVNLLFGLTFSSQANLNGKADSLSYTYLVNQFGSEVIKDTILDSQGNKGDITIPISFGFGIGIKKGLKWLIVADVAIQNWGEYSAFGKTQGLRNSLRTSIGAQFVPDPRPNASYGKRINYRMGLKFAQTSLEIKGTPVDMYGLTVGLGFPVGRSFILQNFSMVNIGMELGQRGTEAKGLIKENYFKLSIGFTINDRWFQQPKFD